MAKRMIRDNTNQSGSLDTDSFARSILNYRNTPCRDTKLSPAEILYGGPIKDHLPNIPQKYNPREEWTLTRERREIALAQRYGRQEKLLNEHTKVLPSLNMGDCVSVQNQCGPRAKKWDKTGLVVETLPHQQYRVRVQGSGRITLRNRQYLRKIIPLQSALSIPLPIVEVAVPSQTVSETPADHVEQPEVMDDQNDDSQIPQPTLSGPTVASPPAPTLALSIPMSPYEQSTEQLDLSEEPVLRRSARPAEPNRMFDDFIMD